MAFDVINVIDDEHGLFRQGANDGAGFTFILAGADDNGIAFFDIHLQHLRSEGNDFHKIRIAEFTSDGAEDTSTARGFIVFNEDGGIFVEADIRAVRAAQAFFRTNDNGFNDVAFFNLSAGVSGFNAGNDDIADFGVTTEGAAEYADTHKRFCAGIISDVEHGLLLNQENHLLSFFEDRNETPTLFFGEGAGFHDMDFIADVSLIMFIVYLEFFGTFNGLFIEVMLNEFLNSDDASFVHFIGDDFTDAGFTFVTELNQGETSF